MIGQSMRLPLQMSKASAAETPDRRLDQARESRGVVGTVATGVDPQGGSPEDVRAAIGCIALWAVPVPGVEIVQDAGPI
jgi:hypothetical protein